jgi:hypothetical protein
LLLGGCAALAVVLAGQGSLDPSQGSLALDPRVQAVQAHLPLYREIRQRALTAALRHPTPDEAMDPVWPLSYMTTTTGEQTARLDTRLQHTHRPVGVLEADYDERTVDACHLTVLFLDPRLGDPLHYGPGEAAWFALESAAAFLSESADGATTTTCVTLLTSDCRMQDYLEGVRGVTQGSSRVHDNNNNTRVLPSATAAVRDKVYAAALPLMRALMDQGRVRLDILDHANYQLQACDDYGNPTAALVNVDFWQDEFSDRDSDWVLFLQDDAVLCRPFHWPDYAAYAYTGAVWPRKATPLAPNPPEGMCPWGMPSLWKLLTLHVKAADYERLQMPPVFDNPCENKGQAPIGNGGLSLRRRSWMRRAIRTCPHVQWSGVADASHHPCRALDGTNEDYYFATVLRGLGAPFPSAVLASQFAVESLFAEQVLDLYGWSDDDNVVAHAPPPPTVTIQGQSWTVPIGFHKPWWYHSNEILLAEAMQEACPYLPFVFTPEMSRWEEHK